MLEDHHGTQEEGNHGHSGPQFQQPEYHGKHMAQVKHLIVHK